MRESARDRSEVDLRAAVQAAMDNKTKPPGSLGRLESLAADLAVATSSDQPSVDPARVIVFAGDHGVARDGVSAFPPEVTAQMCANFTGGGAAVAVLARTVGADLEVVDVGVAADLSDIDGIVDAKVAPGTANLRHGPAMDQVALDAAIMVGREAVRRAAADGQRLIALGEMGIGNTTSAAILIGLLTGADAETVTGPGTGLDTARLADKRGIVADALGRLAPMAEDPASCLKHAGGLEIAAVVGAMLEARSHLIPVLVDGFIVTAAAVVACGMEPEARQQLIFAHRSAEPGHQVALKALNAEPLLDLGMALGEGSGATLALPVLRATCDILADMATFADAGVSGASA
ncbi:MAG: nicotinate-nucleotide--dimethylbenzimidazole phosphoribosyltransferase [Ornithinimicrobium sp.]